MKAVVLYSLWTRLKCGIRHSVPTPPFQYFSLYHVLLQHELLESFINQGCPLEQNQTCAYNHQTGSIGGSPNSRLKLESQETQGLLSPPIWKLLSRETSDAASMLVLQMCTTASDFFFFFLKLGLIM